VRVSRFKVEGVLDSAGQLQRGTIEITREERAQISVRPRFRKRVYQLPLSVVAEMICQRVIKAEVFAKRLAKAAKRKAKR
jgi:hypothetical protein